MRKITAKFMLLLPVFLLLPMFSCMSRADADASAAHSVEAKTYPYFYCYKEGTEECSGEMDLYFIDGGTIPYVALSRFIPVLAEMYNTAMDCEGDDRISFEIQSFGEDEENSTFIITRPDNSSTLIIQPGDDTMLFTNYNAFDQKPGSSALVSILNIPDPVETNDLSLLLEKLMQAQMNGEGTEDLEMLMGTIGAPEDPAADHCLYVATNKIFNRRGSPLTLNLGDYYIDIIFHDGECYLPLQTMNDVFFSLQYINYVFNGEKVIADVYKGSVTDQAYEAGPAEMSEDLALFNFHELCFYLDHFYGLKQEHRIEHFADFIAGDAAKFPQISGTDPVAFDSAMTEILMRFFDDSHSGLVRYSWRSGQPEGTEFLGILTNLGYSAQNIAQASNRLHDARRAVYPDEVPGYEEIGDTAFITFDSFTADRKPEEYYEPEDPDDPQDTIDLIIYANRMVRREGSPVKNIVMDLSLNGGGNSDAALVAASWFTGEARIALLDTMTGAETIASYRTDLNLNGVALSNPDGGMEKYDPGDTVSGQYNLFCMISPQSFSCGNLVPAIFEQAGRITLIGQRSGGGSNAVLPSSTASGYLYQISGPLQITTYRNGSLYGVDTGVEPHVRLNFYDSFYDREALVEMIHNMK